MNDEKLPTAIISFFKEAKMEIYLLTALILIYLITALILNSNTLQKIWFLAFGVSFVVMAIALSFLRFGNQAIMMSAMELSWYYILYLFATIMSVLGIINLWLFRRRLWRLLFNRDDDD